MASASASTLAKPSRGLMGSGAQVKQSLDVSLLGEDVVQSKIIQWLNTLH